jgi:hypothetical protein
MIEYKAFQPIPETNILGLEPILKKDDATGILITMLKKESTHNVVLNIIVENPNNIDNIITGNLEVPFPAENGVKSQIVKINNVIEFVLSTKLIGAQEVKESSAIVANNTQDEKFITVSRKTFADRVRGIDLSQSKINIYKEPSLQSKVNGTIIADLDANLKKIINNRRDAINEERCYKCHEKSNCLIMLSYKKGDVCKQCKNMIAVSANELNINDYKCINCSGIVFINDQGLPNFRTCNSCLDREKRKKNIAEKA